MVCEEYPSALIVTTGCSGTRSKLNSPFDPVATVMATEGDTGRTPDGVAPLTTTTGAPTIGLPEKALVTVPDRLLKAKT
jgi:hypothetical protein